MLKLKPKLPIRPKRGIRKQKRHSETITEYGFWVAKDHTQALAWYRKAAEHGDIGAREIVGQMYFDGKGVQRDFAEAARWFRCPKPSEAILASCKEITYKDLPVRAVQLLQKMKCEVAKDVGRGSWTVTKDRSVPNKPLELTTILHPVCRPLVSNALWN